MLDLRNHSGGLLTAAVEVTEQFLEPGRLILYTEGRARNQNMRFSAHARRDYRAIPMRGSFPPSGRAGRAVSVSRRIGSEPLTMWPHEATLAS